MNHILTIAGRELRSMFSTPVAYVLFAIYLVFAGYMFFLSLGVFLNQLQQIQAFQAFQYLEQMNLNQMVISQSFGTFLVVFIFLIPLLTMRTFAEERANGTIELLLTSPVTSWQAVLGKYLAVLTVVALLVLLSGLYVVLLFFYGNPEPLWSVATLLGLFLSGAALAAIGCFISTLTSSQMIAAVVSMVVGLLLLLLDVIAETPTAAGQLTGIRYLGIREHFENPASGIIRSEDLVYFGVVIVFALTLARTSVESLRWR